MNCPILEGKTFKFESISGPHATYQKAVSARNTVKSLTNDFVVIATYKDFGHHELDDKLKNAWYKAAIGWEHPRSPGVGPDSKIAAKGFFVCVCTKSKKPYSYFQEQSREYFNLLKDKGLVDF